MRKRVLVLLAALAIALPLPAEDTSGSLVATNDGNFHFSLMPTVEIGKLVTTFNFTFYGEFQSDYPWVSFDFSNYQVPEKGSMSKGEYHRTVAEQYAGFIYSMHYGERYDSFYFRYGKLENITLGDGALLSSYYDYSVGYLESRPGLNLKLGPWGRFGQELVVDDLFLPSIFGWRAYIRPFASENEKRFKKIRNMEWGMSILFDPRAKVDMFTEDADGGLTVDYSYRTLFETAFDVTQPFFSGDNGQVMLFADYILQGPHSSIWSQSQAVRLGVGGYIPTGVLSFNASVTTPVKGTYYADYFTTGYNDVDSNDYDSKVTDSDGNPVDKAGIHADFQTHSDDLENTYLARLGRNHPLRRGQAWLDTTMGLAMDNEQVYAGLRFRATVDPGSVQLEDQRVNLIVRIDKLLYNFISLDLNYEKNYPSLTSGAREDFFPGLSTLKNVYIMMHAQIKFRGIKCILGGKWQFDSEGACDNPVFESSMQIVIF